MVYSYQKRRHFYNNTTLLSIYLISCLYIVFQPFIEFSYIDEICTLALGFYGFTKTNILKNKEFKFVFFFLLIYTLYSLSLSINIIDAIINDLLLFLKPILSFYVIYNISCFWSDKTRKKLRCFFIVLGLYTWCIIPFLHTIYGNTTDFYPACIIISLSYLFFSNKNNKDWLISLIFLVPGIFTFRSKFNVELIFFIYLAFFFHKKLTISIKYIFVFFVLLSLSIYIEWEKFSFYFLASADSGIARTVMYYTSFDILKDYFPFGPGFGTFGSDAAAKYYSPLYHKYNLDLIYGLSPNDYKSDSNFLTDTFYPILSQFGVIGIYLYIYFWYKRWKTANKLYNQNYKIFLFILFFMSIQNLASSTFISSISVPIMMLLGFTFHSNNYQNRI